MTTINDEIRSKIEAFADDIATLVRGAALEAVVTALNGSEKASPLSSAKPTAPAKPVPVPAKKPTPLAQAPKPKAPILAAAKPAPILASKSQAVASKKPVAPKRPLGAKRPPVEIAKLTERLGEYIKNNPGLGVEVIGKALNTPTSELTLPIKKLLGTKRIRFEGQRRATKYFPL